MIGEQLHTDNIGDIKFTSYIDAIEQSPPSGFTDQEPETRIPPGSNYHVNDWQPNPTCLLPGNDCPPGIAVVNGQPVPGADRNTRHPFDNHSTIDDNPLVLEQIISDFLTQVKSQGIRR